MKSAIFRIVSLSLVLAMFGSSAVLAGNSRKSSDTPKKTITRDSNNQKSIAASVRAKKVVEPIRSKIYQPVYSVRVISTPPVVRREVLPVQPTPLSIWIPGYWLYQPDINDFIWISGYWETDPPGRRYIPGYWRYNGTYYVWYSGYWVI